MSTGRRRADLVLVERGVFDSRAKAQAAIAAGLVVADGRPVKKASEEIFATAEIVANIALREGADAGALQEALQLQQANARASAFATHPAGKRRIEARRAYRHALLDLLRDVVSGAMEHAARMYTPSTAEDGYEK